MKPHSITLRQYRLLTFSYLVGGTLLSAGSYGAGQGALVACLLGCLLGRCYLALLPALTRWLAGSGRVARCHLLLTLLFLFFLSLSDFGRFFGREKLPHLPPALYAMGLLAAVIYAVGKGCRTVGRFAELSILLLAPLLLILFPGFLGGGASGALLFLPSDAAEVAAVGKSGLGFFLSAFGDALSLAVIGVETEQGEGSVFRRAAEKSRGEGRRGADPLRRALLWGGGAAALWMLTATAGYLGALGAERLSSVTYPTATASSLLHHHLTEPFFLLALTLLYSLRAMVLLLACHRLLSSLLPTVSPAEGVALLSALSFLFLIAVAIVPDLSLHVRRFTPMPWILLWAEIIFPFLCQLFRLFRKKV